MKKQNKSKTKQKKTKNKSKTKAKPMKNVFLKNNFTQKVVQENLFQN